MAPFLFRRKSPIHKIGGLAFFVRSFLLPTSLAWQEFGKQNGMPDYGSFRKKIMKYKMEGAEAPHLDPLIGCNILTDPVFFEPEDYLPLPSDWAMNTVAGKTYDMYEEPGQSLWQAVEALLPKYHGARGSQEQAHSEFTVGEEEDATTTAPETQPAAPSPPTYGYSYRAKIRLGQGGFRAATLQAYGFRCALTGETALPALEAAHIMDHAKGGPHHSDNALLLRSDIHKLFDAGYLGLDSDWRIIVSPLLELNFPEGSAYREFEGKQLRLPKNPSEHPHPYFADWHREQQFLSGQ